VTDSRVSQSPDAPSGRAAHWDKVYREKLTTGVSWYQLTPEPSLSWIQRLALRRDTPILDVGGGASLLVDRLLDAGFSRLTVLDVSATALDHVRARLGRRASEVRWIVGDVTNAEGIGTQEIWHDRAAFHFLTDPRDRRGYLERVAESVVRGGHVLIATFALDGPERCNGLPVQRYDAAGLATEFGPAFSPLESQRCTHVTPGGTQQAFTHVAFRIDGRGQAALPGGAP
jgi:SAM-dependent methyltransferase